MNAKDKLQAAMNKKSTTQLDSTVRESLNTLDKPSVQPEKTGQKTIRGRVSLLEKLNACSLELTVHRKSKMRPLDVSNEMLEFYISKVEEEIGHEVSV